MKIKTEKMAPLQCSKRKAVWRLQPGEIHPPLGVEQVFPIHPTLEHSANACAKGQFFFYRKMLRSCLRDTWGRRACILHRLGSHLVSSYLRSLPIFPFFSPPFPKKRFPDHFFSVITLRLCRLSHHNSFLVPNLQGH